MKIVIVLFSILSAISAPGQEPASCSYIRYANSGQMKYEEVVRGLETAKRPDIFLLGENHFQSGSSRIHHIITEILRDKSERYCLFLEYDPNIDQMTKRLLSWGFYRDIGKTAAKAEMPVVLVDELKAVYPYDVRKNVNSRNHNMAKNIASALTKHLCQKGILIVGKAHNYSAINGKPIDSIQAVLENKFKLSVASVDIVDSFWFKRPPGKYETEYPPVDEAHMGLNGWDILTTSCGPESSTVKPFFGFINPKTEDLCRVPLVFFDKVLGTGGSSCDFDATILL